MSKEQVPENSLLENSGSFDEFLASTIREALMKAMGEKTTEALMYHVQKASPSLHFDSRFDPLLFEQALTSLFGPGAMIIQKIILANTDECLKIRIDDFSPDLVSNLEEIKVVHLSRSRSYDLQNSYDSISA